MSEMAVEVRATLRLRNHAMLAAREAHGLTQRALAEAAGVPVASVQRLEKMDWSFTKCAEHADRIAGLLEMPVDSVLPRDGVGMAVVSTHERMVRMKTGALLAMTERQEMLEAETIQAIQAKDLRELLFTTMHKVLTYREREIIKLRYGLGANDGYTCTLGEIGRIFKLTRGRVQQVERKALRKLAFGIEGQRLLAGWVGEAPPMAPTADALGLTSEARDDDPPARED